MQRVFFAVVFLIVCSTALSADANRFAYLDEDSPWYPHKDFPRLITPQWVGDDGVEAVVVLAIDDMRDTAKYEQYLRPILDRLKQIDGRAPVSIMTCDVKPEDPQLQSWLDEGLSIEVHTVDHPCPILQGADHAKAKSTYDRCVDLLSQIPRNRPVAFRTPCCDSLNTVSPRFYSTIFDSRTPQENYLQIDSSTFNFFTSDDETIPRELVLDKDGNERFLKYMPRDNTYKGLKNDNFFNYIKDYPYPYLINNNCWQFPCVAPSDWSAQHLFGKNNPQTVKDWKAALDITVHKQGVFNLVFHPHGWITAEQIVELIDHAVEKHGTKVKFLTFREAADRLNANLLQVDRSEYDLMNRRGKRLVDVNADGILDVIHADYRTKANGGTQDKPSMSLWENGQWKRHSFPIPLARDSKAYGEPRPVLHRFFDESATTESLMSILDPRSNSVWRFGEDWQQIKFSGEDLTEEVEMLELQPKDFLLRDFDGDGQVELFIRAGADDDGLWQWRNNEWSRADAFIPAIMNSRGADGLRFTDINSDGTLDAICVQDNHWDVRLLTSLKDGWTREVFRPEKMRGTALIADGQPRFQLPWKEAAVDGMYSGLFVNHGIVGWQNEYTDGRADLSYQVTFEDLKKAIPPDAITTAVRAPFRPRGFLRSHGFGESMPLSATTVGAAVVDITPDYPVRLTGYGSRKQEAEDVSAKIHARALVLGGSPIPEEPSRNYLQQPLCVLLTVDNCGVPANVTQAVFEKVEARHGVARERFAISSSHTHSAPWLRQFAPNILLDVPPEHAAHLEQYEAELIENLVAAVDEAVAKRQWATLSLGRGKVGFAINRRSLRDGQWTGFGEVPDGPVDHQFPLLAAHNHSGKLVAVLANYACHATTETGGLNAISGDWPGIASDLIEVDNPGAVALVAIGCGADSNPSPRGTHELSRKHARSVADEVKRLLTRPQDKAPTSDAPATLEIRQPAAELMTAISPRIDCRLANIDLPLGPLPTRAEWEKKATEPAHAGVHGKKFLKMLDEGKAIPTTVPDYPVQTWCFGDDLAMVFLAGEVVIDYSVRLNEMFDSDRLWVNAYSNDVPCYIASKRILREGGYEADRSMIYYAKPTRLAPQAEDIICDTVQKLLPHRFYSEELQTDYPAPKSPEDSLACISTKPDLRVELFAAEPLIQDPVAFDWDTEGRLWVVEMGDYPSGTNKLEGQNNAGGRVRVVSKADGDAKAVTFLDGLSFPSGIHLWRKGVIITCAPEIIYAEDIDGDFKADIKKVLYRGFVEGNQQHRVNGLRYGLDNWLHIANGDSGGDVTVVDALISAASQQSVDASGRWNGALFKGQAGSIHGRDARLRPDQGILDPTFGRTQFCRERDDWGNWFGNNNSNPLWQYIGEDRWFRDGRSIPARTKIDVPEIPGAAPVFPTSRTLSRFNDFDKVNRFTSACSSMIYRDNFLGEDYYGNAFVCEPVHNLVSRLKLKPDGLTFRGTRAEDEQDSEFFASSDTWTRPTMVRTGPDGALWVADMYRQVIEHPEWIPAEAQRKLNLQGGSDRGRIYRIVPAAECCQEGTAEAKVATNSPAKAKPSSVPRPELRTWFEFGESTPADDLILRLASPNGWWRDTAQRLLVHRGHDSETISKLRDMLEHHESPLARLHALCTACELDPLNAELVRMGIKDPHPGVQRHALRLSELFVKTSDAAVMGDVLGLSNSKDPHVLLQIAHLFSALPKSQTIASLPQFLVNVQHSDDMTNVALNAIDSSEAIAVLDGLQAIAAGKDGPAVSQSLLTAIGSLIGQQLNSEQLTGVLSRRLTEEALSDATSQDLQFLAQLLEAVRRRPDVWKHLTGVKQLSGGWKSLRVNVRQQVPSTNSDETTVASLRLLAVIPHLELQDIDAICRLINPLSTPERQSAAVESLVVSGHESVPEKLLSLWPQQTPATRTKIIDALISRSSWAKTLLHSIERGALSAASLSATVREQLLNSKDEGIRSHAKRLFGEEKTSARKEIVSRILPEVKKATADAHAGQAVFEKRCAVCHRLKNIGKSIGADLAAVKDRSTSAMLTAILDPNKAVEAKFLAYSVMTTDGLTHNGMLLNESGNSVTLMGIDGKAKTVARSEIEEFVSSQRSLMPEGLEKDLSIQQLADVISFVQSSSVVWKRFEGNSPLVVQADADGTITLPATAAEIYGPNLAFESKHENLGWWSSTDDHAIWTIDVPDSGHWTVKVDYACHNEAAGGAMKLVSRGRLLSGRVPGTGTWDDYRTWTVGKLDLRRGRQQLIVTAPERPKSALIDLKAIRLIPPE